MPACARLCRRLRADQRGNVLMLLALVLPLLLGAVGFGLDYARAQRLQTKLDAAADAAALATVDPTLLSVTDTAQVKAAAEAMFDQQIQGLSGLTITGRQAIVDDNSKSSLATLRKTTFTYTATSNNIFSGILKMPNLVIGGSAVASASTPPSINFFIAMDTSPSMLLPTTTAGINALKATAWWSGGATSYGRADGCDFACHSVDMQQWGGGVYVIDLQKNAIYLDASDSSNTTFYRVSCNSNGTSNIVYDSNNAQLGTSATLTYSSGWGSQSANTYCSGGSPPNNAITLTYQAPATDSKGKPTTVKVTKTVNYPDTYWLVQNFTRVNPGASSFSLRTDAESLAAQSVISTAYTIQNKYTGLPNAPIYQMQFFTFNLNNPVAITKDASNNSSPFGTMTPVTNLLNKGAPPVVVPNLPGNGYWTNQKNQTVSTNNFDTDLGAMLGGMQSILPASTGAGTQASPQSVLIIITDGMSGANSTSSEMTASDIKTCTAIKKYTRIAILYTQYLPETINYTARQSFTDLANNTVPKIQGALQQCATQNSDGTYLMQTVSTNGDVSAALNTLFAMAVQTARLVQ
jgi:Flp pilus assembly protein TadG